MVRFWIVSFALRDSRAHHDAQGSGDESPLHRARRQTRARGRSRPLRDRGGARSARRAARSVTVTDAKRPRRACGPRWPQLPAGDRARSSAATGARPFLGADLIVLSPGVPPRCPELAAARAAGVAITGELELASRFVERPSSPSPAPTASRPPRRCVGEMLRATGRPTFVGGNLGEPLAEAVGTPAGAAGRHLRRRGVELPARDGARRSTRASPCCSTSRPITSIATPDLDGYAAAKARIFAAQTARRLRRGELRRSRCRCAPAPRPQPPRWLLDRPRRWPPAPGSRAIRSCVQARRAAHRVATRRDCPGSSGSGTTRPTRWRRCWPRAWSAPRRPRRAPACSRSARCAHRMELVADADGIDLLRRLEGDQRRRRGRGARRLPAPGRPHRRRPRQGRRLRAAGRGAARASGAPRS